MSIEKFKSLVTEYNNSGINTSTYASILDSKKSFSYSNSWYDKVVHAFALGEAIYKLGKGAHNIYQSRTKSDTDTTIYEVTTDNTLFGRLVNDAIVQLIEEYQKEEVIITDFVLEDSGVLSKKALEDAVLFYNGADISVHYNRTSPQSNQNLARRQENSYTWTFSSTNLKALGDFSEDFSTKYKELVKAATNDVNITPEICRWSSARQSIEYQGTLLENKEKSLFLAQGQKELLFKTLDDFQESRQNYFDLGVPYKLGICLYGPPGTGKTSTIKAISRHTGRDIYYVSLETIKDNEMLNSAMEYGEDRIIVFEDLDILPATHQDSVSSTGITSGISRQGLLNILDGINSPQNAIFVLTTNNRDCLDAALTRAGRVDLELELDYFDQYQLDSMLEFLRVEESIKLPESVKITGADVVGVARKYIKDTSQSGPAIQEFISRKEKELYEDSRMGDPIQASV